MDRNLKILSIGLSLAFSVFVLFLMSSYTHSLPDYSYHLHKIWVISEGHFLSSPFAGGLQLFKYGFPVCLFGAFIYPIFGEVTLVILSLAALVLLFFASKKVYSHFVSDEKAKICAFFSVMNPGTFAFVLGGTVPFLWAVAVGMFSLGFFLDNKMWESFFLGVFTVFIHPLGIFVFLILFFFKDMRNRFLDWFKVYFPPVLLSLVILIQFFGFLSGFHYSGGFEINHLLRLPFLMVVLVLTYVFRDGNRRLVGIAFIGILVSSLLYFFGFNFPMAYVLRPTFVFVLFLIPFIFQKWMDVSLGRRKLILGGYCVVVLFSVLFQPVAAPGMQKSLEEENEVAADVSQIVENDSVFLASRGEEFYELPRENVEFVNSGVIRWAHLGAIWRPHRRVVWWAERGIIWCSWRYIRWWTH